MPTRKPHSSKKVLSLAEFYERYSSRMHKLARARLHDEDEAWDVVQDTFLAYMQRQTSGHPLNSAPAVLFQIVKNKAVDRFRRRVHGSGGMPPLKADGEEAVLRHGQAATVGAVEFEQVAARHDLKVLTHGESDETLDMVYLHRVEGLTLTEVGHQLERSRKQVARCLRQFTKRASRRDRSLSGGRP